MTAPEGSDERRMARRVLVQSASLCARQMTREMWIARIARTCPELVRLVGPEDVTRIANYAWRG